MVKKLGTKKPFVDVPVRLRVLFRQSFFFPPPPRSFRPYSTVNFFFLSLLATPSENSNLNKRNDYQMLLKYMYRLREVPIHIILLYYYCFL